MKDDDEFVRNVPNGEFEQSISFDEEKTYSVIVKVESETGKTINIQKKIIYKMARDSLTDVQ